MKRLVRLLAAAALLAPLALSAQGFPGGQITLVVPYQAGGPVDLIPRAVAPRLAAALGVPVIVENRPGAGGNVGSAYVAKANPDGATLLATAGSALTVNKWLFKQLNYDPERDFAPISRFAETPNVFVVHPDVKASSIQDLIALAKAQPGVLNYGTPGPGTSPHLCMELLSSSTGNPKLTHVPYKGGAEAVKDLLANRIQLACSNITPVLSHVKSGRLRALAVTTKARHAMLPDVPTAEEAGVAGFEMAGWFALLAPARTPGPVIERLNTEVVKALRDPEVAARLQGFGVTPVGDSPAEFARYFAAELSKWRKLIEETKLSIE